MHELVKPIAVVHGAPGAVVQRLFAQLVAEWRPSVRLAGVLAEDHGLPDRGCSAGHLRSIASGELFPIFQDLGPGSIACHLEGSGALTAAAAVRRDIAAGCDLVVLSKFGKLEAGGQGLRDAFDAAIEAELPVLTSVSPAFETAWGNYALPLFVMLPADTTRIRAWWQAIRPHADDGGERPHSPGPYAGIVT